MNTGGAVALDDVTILPGGCYSEPPINPPPDDDNGNLKPSSATLTEHTDYLDISVNYLYKVFWTAMGLTTYSITKFADFSSISRDIFVYIIG